MKIFQVFHLTKKKIVELYFLQKKKNGSLSPARTMFKIFTKTYLLKVKFYESQTEMPFSKLKTCLSLPCSVFIVK